jgi:glycosyltransferase involved in cell wall biosynthesis
MITVLVRTSNRPELFNRCIASIESQTYSDYNILVAYDDDRALSYIPDRLDKIKVTPDKSFPFYWNLYCNDLKENVNNGWFLYCDDDDYLTGRTCLEELSKELLNPDEAVICRFIRNRKPKPDTYHFSNKIVVRGKIGGSCIVLHHSKKNVAMWDGYKAADYRFICDVKKRMPLKWVNVTVVTAGNNGLKGKMV